MTPEQTARFVAFAFTGADLLIEIMPDDGLIGFTAGLSKKITGLPPESLQKKSLYDFLIESEKSLFKHNIKKMGPSGRLKPALYHVQLNGKSKPILIGACRLENYPSVFVTLATVETFLNEDEEVKKHDTETGLLTQKDFQDKITSYINTNRESFDTGSITLVEINQALNNLPAEQSKFVLGQIGSYMRSSSLDGDMAVRLDENRFSIVHDDIITPQNISEYISDLVKLIDPSSNISVQTKNIACAANDVSATETASALLYCLNKFSERGLSQITTTSLGESLNEMMDETLKKVSALNQVISADSYKIVFQPIVNMKDGTTHHYEALSRFENHASPFEMITFAEEIGKIQELDLFVCRQVAQQLMSMAGSGKRPYIAVNLSAKSMDSAIFVKSLHQLLTPFAAIAKQMIFELTESVMITDYNKINNAIQSFREKGHIFCLDDVGAGASSLLYIRHFDVDYAKIDGSYVRNIQNNTKNLSFVKTIVTLCRDVGIDVIAEMVETQEEATILKNLGITFGQGYLFGKPSEIMGDLHAINPKKPRINTGGHK